MRYDWADINADGVIDFFDVDPYLAILFAPSAISRVFTWDAENRLVQVAPAASFLPTDGSARRVSFVYDSQGRRVEKVVETWTAGTPPGWQETQRRRYVWNGWLLLLELDGENDVLRKYTWGRDLSGSLEGAGGIGGLLAVRDETVATGVDYIFCYDANGNVGQVVDLSAPTAAASLAARYEYDPYGQITGPDTDADGDWRDDAGSYASTNAWRFSTKQWDDETGLGYWGYRYYSARLGRWVSRDPWLEAGGLNLYAHALNQPTGRFDGLGLLAQAPQGGGDCGFGQLEEARRRREQNKPPIMGGGTILDILPPGADIEGICTRKHGDICDTNEHWELTETKPRQCVCRQNKSAADCEKRFGACPSGPYTVSPKGHCSCPVVLPGLQPPGARGAPPAVPWNTWCGDDTPVTGADSVEARKWAAFICSGQLSGIATGLAFGHCMKEVESCLTKVENSNGTRSDYCDCLLTAAGLKW